MGYIIVFLSVYVKYQQFVVNPNNIFSPFSRGTYKNLDWMSAKYGLVVCFCMGGWMVVVVFFTKSLWMAHILYRGPSGPHKLGPLLCHEQLGHCWKYLMHICMSLCIACSQFAYLHISFVWSTMWGLAFKGKERGRGNQRVLRWFSDGSTIILIRSGMPIFQERISKDQMV